MSRFSEEDGQGGTVTLAPQLTCESKAVRLRTGLMLLRIWLAAAFTPLLSGQTKEAQTPTAPSAQGASIARAAIHGNYKGLQAETIMPKTPH